MKRFFTLIELLVVIAIIAVLASLLLPALNKAKQYGKSIGCKNNCKQVALLLEMYKSDWNSYHPAAIEDAGGGSFQYNKTWYVKIAQYANASVNWGNFRALAKYFVCPAESHYPRTAADPGPPSTFLVGRGGFQYRDNLPDGTGFWIAPMRTADIVNPSKKGVAHADEVVLAINGDRFQGLWWAANNFSALDFCHPGLTINTFYMDGHAASTPYVGNFFDSYHNTGYKVYNELGR